MPLHTIHLPPELDQFIAARIATGRYGNASEVMAAALHSLERDELDEEYESKLATLRAAIDAGDASGTAPGDMHDVFARVRSRRGWGTE